MAFRRPGGVDRSLDFEPVQGHAGAGVFGGTPRDLSDAQASPWDGNGIEDDGLMGVDPCGDFSFLRLEGGGREGRKQASAFLLFALFMGTEHGGLGFLAGNWFALIPLESPDGESHSVHSGVDGGHIHSGLVSGEVGIEESDGALAFGAFVLFPQGFAFLEIRAGVAHVAGFVLKAAANG
jgi:hypothetical protein